MATTDVVTPAKTGVSTLKINGNATVYFDRKGNYQTLSLNGEAKTTTPEAVEAKLGNKFDDPTYYTA